MGTGSDELDPIQHAQDWDHVVVTGITSPGTCKVTGFKRAFGWDVKKGKGAKGSTVTLNEYPPAEGTITFRFWEPEHFEAWREFRDIWNYDPTKKPIAAVDIFYPSLADLDIKSVVCKHISTVDPVGQGFYEVSIDLIEYNPPPKKKADGSPSGSNSTSKTKTPGATDDPIADEIQRQIKGELDQAKKPTP